MSENHDRSMHNRPLRETWKSNHQVSQVREALKQKIQWHKERYNSWVQEREGLLAEAGTRGIKMDRAELMKAMSYSSSNRFDEVGPRIDPEYARELGNADQKVKEHRDKVRDFSEWDRSLAHMNQGEVVTLEHTDRVFFGLTFQTEAQKDEDEQQ